MKTCSNCAEIKPLDDFASKSSRCKPCHRLYTREHYQNNKTYYVDKARRNEHKYSLPIKEHIWNFLLKNPCVTCGETDPVVLEFDHIDPSQKSFSISEASKKKTKIEDVQKEIDKCQVLCANCHRRKTFEQFGWWTGYAGISPLATNQLKG